MFLIFAFLVRVRLSSLFFFSLDVTCCALSTVFLFVCLDHDQSQRNLWSSVGRVNR